MWFCNVVLLSNRHRHDYMVRGRRCSKCLVPFKLEELWLLYPLAPILSGEMFQIECSKVRIDIVTSTIDLPRKQRRKIEKQSASMIVYDNILNWVKILASTYDLNKLTKIIFLNP